MKLEAPKIPWIEPWEALDAEKADGLAEELHREICNQEHVLFGHTVVGVGSRRDIDDFLFYLGPTPPSLALVHLTWNRELRREWPHTEFFDTVEDWVERGMKAATIDYEQSHKRRDGAA